VSLTNLDGNTLKSSYTVNPNTVGAHENQIYYSVAGDTVYYIMKSTDTLPTADDFTARDIGFAGWYDNPECTGEPVTSVNSNSFVTYYAKFDVEANEYTVSFNMNGQSGQIFDKPSSQKVKHGKLVTKPSNPYNRNQNPLFAGWYLDSACTKPYDFSTPVTKSFTLYAKWASSVKVVLMWYSDPT